MDHPTSFVDTSAADHPYALLGSSARQIIGQNAVNNDTSHQGSSSFSPRAWLRWGGFIDGEPDQNRTSPQAIRQARHQQQQPPPIDERDICPICNIRLPPVAEDGNEEAREAHVRDCIESHGAGSHSSSHGNHHHPPHPPHPMRMVTFTATEKDCTTHDGTMPECSICMEEYEVGEKLARLECLCKFHKQCIVEWFERKKECPVHKTI